jgi:hypothetical protein
MHPTPVLRGEERSPQRIPTLADLSSPSQKKGGDGVLLTDDLFLGAFGLTRGGELRDVEVRGVNGRRVAFFRIEGDGMEEVERDYYRGTTSVNLQLLKAQVRRLKDVAFAAMRNAENKTTREERRNESQPRRHR